MKIKSVTAAIGLAGFFAALYSLMATPVSAAAADAPDKAKSNVEETVDAGDTLSSIANHYQTTYVRLFNANRQVEHPDVIHPGEVLRIPDQAEQLPDRPLPGAAAIQTAVPSAAAVRSTTANLPSSGGVAASGDTWDKLAYCESRGNWAINTGNGFYGGLQFTLSSWRGVGGSGYPHEASREQQIAMAEKLLAKQGWGAWPACTSKLGLR